MMSTSRSRMTMCQNFEGFASSHTSSYYIIRAQFKCIRWVEKLSLGNVNSWDIFKKAFIQRYYPPSKPTKQLEEICTVNRQLLDSQGPIPGMTSAQALTAIQTMADHSQKWHDGSSSRNIDNSSNSEGIVAIVSKLDSLGQDMKKLKENVHAIQVGCQTCGGAHLDKECPLNEEVKIVEEVKYGEFRRSSPFNNGAKYHVGRSGYYTHIENRPPFGEKRPSLEELMIKHLEESTRRRVKIEDWVAQEEGVSSRVLPCQLPPKELNLGNFILPCTIRSLNFYDMTDLGASVNVIPKSMFEYLKLARLMKADMLVEMADMIKRAPIGIVENVRVKIDKFLFPSDFVVIDMLNARNEITILERPFLATIHAEIDVFNKEISEQSRKKTRMLKSDTYIPSVHFCKHVKKICSEILKVWPTCDPTMKGDNTYWWHDHGLEENERQESGLDMEEYAPPKVLVETFKVKRYSFDSGQGYRSGLKDSWGLITTTWLPYLRDFRGIQNRMKYRTYLKCQSGLTLQEASGSHGLLEASGSDVRLELIQEDDTQPSNDTSEQHNEVEPNEVEPHCVKVPIRRSEGISQAHDMYCFYVDAEEHGLGDHNEPPNYKAALSDSESDKWLDVMNAEKQSMKDNQVWCLVDLPSNGRIVGSKWFFKKKTNMDRNVHTFKARLVAKSYTQTYGVDYRETFSPIADIRAIRILLAIVAFTMRFSK
ncbi:putative reverse transcriptase domain-containing protein [Tanacetum coccineum]|uniref:Reverse transcriptase domain-containing protein n=1 Tax=Tanacetum coccineum TaxID=301880 RepID=A0ABQ5B896_9ASTR